jgi:1,2-phenylacetyl-CoA epoxidase PaaB subunit
VTPAPRVVRKKVQAWEVRRLKGTPAAFVGIVYAPDEKTARKVATEQFKIRAKDARSLLIRKA